MHSREIGLVGNSHPRGMPTFRFPDTGTTVSWPRYRNGTVTIVGAIPLPEGQIPMCLYLPRQGLRMLARLPGASPSQHLDHEAARIATALCTYAGSAAEWPPRETDLLQTGARTWAKIEIRRDYLICLGHSLSQPGAYGRLRLVIRFIFLRDEIVSWSRRLPRGQSKRTWPLKRCLPFLLLAARLLIETSRHDTKIGQKVHACIEEDGASLAYWMRFKDDPDSLQQLALIVALLDRALRGAWERYGLKRPCSVRDPREVLRSHYYGMEAQRQQTALAEVKGRDPEWKEDLTWFAETLLLGPPGAAARQYGLFLK